MDRKKEKAVECKQCHRIFKTTRTRKMFCSDECRCEYKKEYLRNRIKIIRQKKIYDEEQKNKRQEKIRKNEYIYKLRKISIDTGLSYGLVKAWHNNSTALKRLIDYYAYVGKERYRVIKEG